MKPGDIAEVEIEKIGTLYNRIEDDKYAARSGTRHRMQVGIPMQQVQR
jgi:fumarylacetoacetate (FAA) hydrolase family protein